MRAFGQADVERKPEFLAQRGYLEQEVVGIRRGLPQLQIARPHLVRPRGGRDQQTRQGQKHEEAPHRTAPRAPLRALGRRFFHHDPVARAQGAIKRRLGFQPAGIRPLPPHRRPDRIERRQPSLRTLADQDEMHSVARRDGALPTPLLQLEERFSEALAECATGVAARHIAELVTKQEVVAQRRSVDLRVLACKLGGDGLGVALQRVAACGAEVDMPECQPVLAPEPFGVRRQIGRELAVARLRDRHVLGDEFQLLAQAAADDGVVAVKSQHLALAIEHLVANVVLDRPRSSSALGGRCQVRAKPFARFSIRAAETTISAGSASFLPTRLNRPNSAAPSTRKCSSGSFSRRIMACIG